MRYLSALLGLAFATSACGVDPATYAVDLTLTERCDTRNGVEICRQPIGELRSTNLMVDPRQDRVLLWLDDDLYWAEQSWPTLRAQRLREHEDLDNDCLRRNRDQLELTFGFNSVEGGLISSSETTGEAPACGQTPFGQRLSQDLRGVEVTGP